MIGPNSLVLTILWFSVYPQMSNIDVFSPIITQRSIIMQKTIQEVKRFHLFCQVYDGIMTRSHDLGTKLLVPRPNLNT